MRFRYARTEVSLGSWSSRRIRGRTNASLPSFTEAGWSPDGPRPQQEGQRNQSTYVGDGQVSTGRRPNSLPVLRSFHNVTATSRMQLLSCGVAAVSSESEVQSAVVAAILCFPAVQIVKALSCDGHSFGVSARSQRQVHRLNTLCRKRVVHQAVSCS